MLTLVSLCVCVHMLAYVCVCVLVSEVACGVVQGISLLIGETSVPGLDTLVLLFP